MEAINMQNQASGSDYDVILVGAGLGGLTAGALLAKVGKRVLVVEQGEYPGGFIREFRYGPYKINPAIHSIFGCNPGGQLGQGIIDAVLEHLGVRDQCQFIAVDPFYRAKFPDFQMDIPLGRDAFLDAYLSHFPGEAEGLRGLVDLCSVMFKEAMQFPALPRWQDWLLMPFRSPKIFRYGTSTLASVLDRYLSDSRLKSVYAVCYPYLALPPSRLSFFIWSIMMAGYIEQGAFYCQGGFQNLAGAFADGLIKHGGELLLEMPVNKIRVTGGSVQGIILGNGQEIDAPVVISNIDARKAFQELLEANEVPTSYLRRIRELEPSASVLGLFLATDLDVHALGIPKVTLPSSWDLEDTYKSALHGNPKLAAVHVPTVIDESLAPAGEHLVIIQSFVPAETERLSPSAGAAYAEGLLDLAEQVLPDLRKHITFMVGASDEEQQKYPLQRIGPIYGWANSVGQAGPRRLPYKTPVSGLYLAGHWTQPGSGVWTVVLSGVNAARYVIGKDMSQAIWSLDL
jgi:phytoene dehydrogenase-like protein